MVLLEEYREWYFKAAHNRKRCINFRMSYSSLLTSKRTDSGFVSCETAPVLKVELNPLKDTFSSISKVELLALNQGFQSTSTAREQDTFPL